jgi:serine protein kinase
LQIVRERPQVTRNAYQRMYDMIISYGTEEYIDNKKKLVRYNFFKDEDGSGANAIFGLDIPLMRLVHVLKAASEGYGPEKRVILLHGPVGSSKSTIARLLKLGIEKYSRTADGALYSFDWIGLAGTDLAGKENDVFASPMNEEPLRLIPMEWRDKAILETGLSNEQFKVKVDGDLWRWIPALRRELDGYAGRYGVMSFDPRLPRLLKTNLPVVRRGLVVRHSLSPLKRWLALRLASPDFLAVDRAGLGEAWVARARKRLPIYGWAIDSAEQRRTASVHADALIWEADGRP